MRKFFVGLVWLAVTSVSSAHDLAPVMESVLPSIAYIRVERFESRDKVNEVTREVTKVEVPMVPIVGTGFIIDGNNVVTNHHVIAHAIENNTKIEVSFIDDNKRYEAEIIGYDQVADVALLEIEGDHPSVVISPCNKLAMGDEVFSISNFYGIGWSATQGSVSSNQRHDSRYPYINNIQLQLLTGTGSSGGPVFNEKGEVVALNRSIVSMFPSRISLGRNAAMLSMVAFPVRGDSVLESIERIRDELIVRRVDLGVRLIPFGTDSAYHLNQDEDFFTGVIVLNVDKTKSPELVTSDLIVAVEGRTFSEPAELLMWLDDKYEVGDTINMEVYRDEQVINIAVTLGVAGK